MTYLSRIPAYESTKANIRRLASAQDKDANALAMEFYKCRTLDTLNEGQARDIEESLERAARPKSSGHSHECISCYKVYSCICLSHPTDELGECINCREGFTPTPPRFDHSAHRKVVTL